MRPGVGLHRLEQLGVDGGELCSQRLDVRMDVPEHEQVARAELAVQRGGQILAFELQASARHAEQLLDVLLFDQALDHRAGAHAVDVADHRAKLDAAVVQDLVQPIDLAGAHRTELAPIARDQAQLAQVLRRDEAAAHEAEARQHGQPLGVGHVGLAPGHVLDEVRVDDPGPDAGALQVREHALPVDAGALQ